MIRSGQASTEAHVLLRLQMHASPCIPCVSRFTPQLSPQTSSRLFGKDVEKLEDDTPVTGKNE
eukprot:1146583-Pelagomonas_calceolata.AAC.2